MISRWISKTDVSPWISLTKTMASSSSRHLEEEPLSDDNDTPIITDKRKSPEFVARLKAQGFQKGRKKTGGTVPIPAEVKKAMAERTPEALEVMIDLMHNSRNDTVRFKASEYVLRSVHHTRANRRPGRSQSDPHDCRYAGNRKSTAFGSA
jgi:hypothetical protein